MILHQHSGSIRKPVLKSILSKWDECNITQNILRTYFSIRFYDLDGDGCITRPEMLAIITATYEMVHDTQTNQPAIKIQVDRFFEKMDADRDGIVTREEFMSGCKNVRPTSSTFRDAIIARLSDSERQKRVCVLKSHKYYIFLQDTVIYNQLSLFNKIWWRNENDLKRLTGKLIHTRVKSLKYL